MGHASNMKIIKASKFFTKMRDFNTEYNPEEVYSNPEQSKSNNNTKVKAIQEIPKLLIAFAFYITKIYNNFNSLCIPCISSKQTQVVNCSKPITKVKKKLEEIYVDLWGPHNLLLLSEKTYAVILMDAKTYKI